MEVSIWGGIHPSPQLVQKMKERIPASNKDLFDFADRSITFWNEEIKQMTEEGREKCFVNYSLPMFRAYESDADNSKGVVMIQYDIYRDNFNARTMAIAQVELDNIKIRHEHLVQIYEAYDKNVKKFKELRGRIHACGGDIKFMRPYIEVTLPLEEKPLMTETYKVTAHSSFCNALMSRLNALEWRFK